MKNHFLVAGYILCAALGVVACSTAQLQQAQTDFNTGVTVVNVAACDLQKAANDAGAAATAIGDTQVASIASDTSKAAGSKCMSAAPAPVPAS